MCNQHNSHTLISKVAQLLQNHIQCFFVYSRSWLIRNNQLNSLLYAGCEQHSSEHTAGKLIRVEFAVCFF